MTVTSLVRWLVLCVFLGSSLGACGDDGGGDDGGGDDGSAGMAGMAGDGDGDGDGDAEPVKGANWDYLYEVVLTGSSCNSSFCHGAGQGMLRMFDADSAYEAMFDVEAMGMDCASSGLKRIDPSSPDDSLLVLKLRGDTVPCGLEMPGTGFQAVSDEDLGLLREWIADGAPRE